MVKPRASSPPFFIGGTQHPLLCVTGDLSVLLPLLQLQTDLGSGEFSGDDACIAVTEVDKDFDVFQFHHEPLPCTNHCNFDERAKLFLREKCLLPRQKLKRACDAMGTGAHDVARDDTQISHFLGLFTLALSGTLRLPISVRSSRSPVSFQRACLSYLGDPVRRPHYS